MYFRSVWLFTRSQGWGVESDCPTYPRPPRRTRRPGRRWGRRRRMLLSRFSEILAGYIKYIQFTFRFKNSNKHPIYKMAFQNHNGTLELKAYLQFWLLDTDFHCWFILHLKYIDFLKKLILNLKRFSLKWDLIWRNSIVIS